VEGVTHLVSDTQTSPDCKPHHVYNQDVLAEPLEKSPEVGQVKEKERQVPQHDPLEHLQSVLWAEWHAQELEQPKA